MARLLPHHRECKSQSHIPQLHPLPHTRLTTIVFAYVDRASEHILPCGFIARIAGLGGRLLFEMVKKFAWQASSSGPTVLCVTVFAFRVSPIFPKAPHLVYIDQSSAGARHVVVTDLNPFRLNLAREMGATLAVDPREQPLREVQKQLGMFEGFDVGLEMSGNPQALREMIANMSHGGKIAILGLPANESTMDWRQVIFNMLTIKGIYGREMYETWYKMSVMLDSGLDISPVITHRFAYHEFQKGFDAMVSGQAGKVVLDRTGAL